MNTMEYNNNFVYEFKATDESTDKLIIIFEGSGWNSALGEYINGEWQFTEIGAQIIQVLRKDHVILIPEKWNRKPELDYFEDQNARYIYTKENLMKCYVTSIDAYLAEREFYSIVLIGTSEGAALLPLVYEKMKDKELVKGIVSIAFGGLSIYESYKINIMKSNISQDWKNVYSYVIKTYENISEYSESTEVNSYGVVYRWLASFIDLRPFDYYKNINIPILFIHGKQDWNMAIESTKYIQENLPEKPFEYIFYKNMGHIPLKYFETVRFRNDIKKWIISKNI
jgi:esterase/lipase